MKRILCIAMSLLTSALFLTACGTESQLQAFSSQADEILAWSDEKTKTLNKEMYGDVLLSKVQEVFEKQGYPPFIELDDEPGLMSMHPNGNVVYIYSKDGKHVTGITYRYFVETQTFNDTIIAPGVNSVSGLIDLVLGRDTTVDEKKSVKKLYSELIAAGEESKSKNLKIDGIIFCFSIETLSQTLMCSYTT